ncbi:G-type lectin S-receptor-like serine/threonine-protein kinase [Tanacetum coccineum]
MALPSSSYSKFNASMAPHVLSFLLYLFFNGASGTTITVVNECGFTVWPGILGRPVLNVSGTGCTFQCVGHGSCATGDCGGEMECNGRNYTQPVTILELDVNTVTYDFYNVSLMKGFNLPRIWSESWGDSC